MRSSVLALEMLPAVSFAMSPLGLLSRSSRQRLVRVTLAGAPTPGYRGSTKGAPWHPWPPHTPLRSSPCG